MCNNNGAPYINDLQLDYGAVTNCPDAYVAAEQDGPLGIGKVKVCSQSFHPNTAGWEAEAGLLRSVISSYEATAHATSCISKLRPFGTEGPGTAGDYRLGEQGGAFAPTSGPTSGPGPFAALGGVYADELNCSPWVEPSSTVSAGVDMIEVAVVQQAGLRAARDGVW